jgi:uncharacterized protein (TIGR02118 family)
MIQVSVLYPNQANVHFDFDYYSKKHIEIVRECLGKACKAIAVNRGVGGVVPGEAAPFIVMGHLYFDSMESFQQSFTPHAERIMADTANFTDSPPLIQISAVELVP